jgi:signal peptidase I
MPSPFYKGKHAAPRGPEAGPPSFPRWLGQIVVLLTIAAVLAFGIRTFVVQPFLIPSSSMEDTLLIGDGVLVNMFAYRFEQPKVGDIVVFSSAEDTSSDLIKRVVAVGGQTVDIRDGVLYVDGRQQTEPYVNEKYPDHYAADAPVSVPSGTVYVLGDNRANSEDSRYIGPQPVSAILGRAFAICWPVSRIGVL